MQTAKMEGAVVTAPFDRIFLNDYVREIEVGAYAEEYGVTQGVRFHVTLEVLPGAISDDTLDSVVSYDDLVAAIEKVIDGPRIALLETFAEQIAMYCLRHPRAHKVIVKIEKLERLPGGAVLGVEITRPRIVSALTETAD